MSSQISTNLVPSQHGNTSKENRHLSRFKPSFWGDIFLSSPSEMEMDAGTQQEYEELKQEVRRMLVANTDKSSQKLFIIDAVQRLGVAYRFEKEIEEALEIIYHHHCNHIEIDGGDLYTTAVRFRLLREHGFDVHCGTFNKFKDENGNFKESLIGDVKGMLELYEAAHFQLHGESILEEALSFTTFHLKLAESMVDYPLSTQISNALKRPLRKSLPRLIARSYISIYEGYVTQDENLLKFAKLDFKILQHLHKKEINKINRWWKGLDVKTNFPFIRDRFVECYFWMLSVYFEPHYAIARTFATKVICLISILDDIYDAWDINCIDQLPDYMKVWYSETLNVYKEMEDLMSKEGKSYRVQVAIEAMKRQSQVYHAEIKWLHENYIPTMEEFMQIASVSGGYWNLTISCFAEQEREHVSSAVECYMKQYGVSMQEAYDELHKQINNHYRKIGIYRHF
ncbi:hypothetical protein CXB51_029133 [Gossypium anomalum]|uniref:(+)-delta-cadinene synthase n=1 Tax=Gossypium anomalum TaxID=47600 RepID=A0A8J5YDV4_9ROSI|nr:hypothetical protein CXB51_029133 [Gossypium anomalum]